jgi:hypothetical protein
MEKKYTAPENDYEALVLALRLAITAPTEEQSQECLAIARQLDVSELEIARAKSEVTKS